MLVNRIANTQQSQQSKRPIERPLKIEFLAVGGGAGGCNAPGGGGGAGGLITGSFCAVRNVEYTLEIGSGSSAGGDFNYSAQDTVVFGVTAIGGGASSGYTRFNEEPGGSGGGSGADFDPNTIALQPSASYVGFGNNGGLSGGPQTAGGGGGAGGPGGNSGATVGGNAGAALELDFYPWNPQDPGIQKYPTRFWAPGGYGGGDGSTPNNNGNPATRPTQLKFETVAWNMGRGGHGNYVASGSAENGYDGGVVIRYTGAPKAEGGTIDILTDPQYTYHLYTSSGDFTFKVTLNDDNFSQNNCNDGTSV